MTTATQFQTQGAFETYLPVRNGAIYVGSDTDNSNASGSLCSTPYYKRGYITASAAGTASQTITIPGSSSVISIYLENRNAVAITAGTFTITGAYRYNNGVASNSVVTASLGTTLTSQTAANLSFTSTAPSDGGAYFTQDIGQSYATITLALSGATGLTTNNFLVYIIGFADSSFYTVPGQ